MGRHSHADDAVDPPVTVHSDQMSRLAEAQAALERARRQPEKQSRWRRKSTASELEVAAYAVQVAAEAAHGAGATWTEIGDVLGINRATPAPAAPHRGRLVVLHPEADPEDSEAQQA